MNLIENSIAIGIQNILRGNNIKVKHELTVKYIEDEWFGVYLNENIYFYIDIDVTKDTLIKAYTVITLLLYILNNHGIIINSLILRGEKARWTIDINDKNCYVFIPSNFTEKSLINILKKNNMLIC